MGKETMPDICVNGEGWNGNCQITEDGGIALEIESADINLSADVFDLPLTKEEALRWSEWMLEQLNQPDRNG